MRHKLEHKIDQDTLDCIARFQATNGYSPTYSQIAECLGLKGKSSVHNRIERLRKAGLIETMARSRAIVILKKGKK